MPAFQVQRSHVIAAPIESVFDTVADFGTWTKWSPWLRIDKEAEVKVSDDPRSLHSTYHWSGELVGRGEIEHMRLERPNSIEDELRFLEPYESTSQVRFLFEPQGDATRITWEMHGKLPWFLFWMRSNMESFLGMDYQRGLRMLGEFIETGTVISETEVIGIEPIDSMNVYGVRDSSTLAEIGNAIEKAIEIVQQEVGSDDTNCQGEMVSVYHPCDLRKGRMDFTAGFAISEKIEVPGRLSHCQIPAGDALHIRHTGKYDNLGNAWSGAHQYARYKKIKLARRDAIEIYRNDPAETSEKDLVTDIYLLIK